MTLIATDSNRNTPDRLNNTAIANGKSLSHDVLTTRDDACFTTSTIFHYRGI